MSVTDPYSKYLENHVTTATPGRILVMALDAAIRFARLAAQSMNEGALDAQSANIRRTQNILLELMSSLDATADGRLAANLSSLYSYMFDRLTQANIGDDAAALQEVIDLLTEMRSTWTEAERLVRSGGAAKAGGSRRAA